MAEDIEVAASLPANFTLELTSPPPAEAIEEITSDSDSDFPAGAATAQAAIVVYDDRDGDGELDLLGPGAAEEIDAIIGWRPDVEIWSITGLPHAGSGQPARGLALPLVGGSRQSSTTSPPALLSG